MDGAGDLGPHEGPTRFGQLRRRIGEPAPKVLTTVLRSLERDGAVVRRVYTKSSLRVEYALTPLGRSVRHVVEGLASWAQRNVTRVARARARYDSDASASE